MNNYFGLGIDAELSLDFHHAREEEPDKFNSRWASSLRALTSPDIAEGEFVSFFSQVSQQRRVCEGGPSEAESYKKSS